jgi:hypothetical protein
MTLFSNTAAYSGGAAPTRCWGVWSRKNFFMTRFQFYKTFTRNSLQYWCKFIRFGRWLNQYRHLISRKKLQHIYRLDCFHIVKLFQLQSNGLAHKMSE